jgi:hypothetical protein
MGKASKGMRRTGKLVAAVLAGTAGILLSACIPVPLVSGYEDDSRQNVPAQAPAFVVPGRTTREDVVLALGEPDRSAVDGSWLLYGSGYGRGGLALLAVGGAGGALGVAEEKMRYRLLIFRFDDTGVVSSTEMKEKFCPEWSMVAVPGPGPAPAPCFELSGDDLVVSDLASAAAPGERVIGTYPHVVWWQGQENPPDLALFHRPERPGEWAALSITDRSLVLTPSGAPIPGADFVYVVSPITRSIRLPLTDIREATPNRRYLVPFITLALADGTRCSIQVMTGTGGSTYIWDYGQTRAAAEMLRESIKAATDGAGN